MTHWQSVYILGEVQHLHLDLLQESVFSLASQYVLQMAEILLAFQ